MNILNMIAQLKALQGELYILIILKRISLSREIFLMNIEIGMETMIPRDLSQEGLPASFKYYDPI
jgi:hypothetical protein